MKNIKLISIAITLSLTFAPTLSGCIEQTACNCEYNHITQGFVINIVYHTGLFDNPHSITIFFNDTSDIKIEFLSENFSSMDGLYSTMYSELMRKNGIVYHKFYWHNEKNDARVILDKIS